MPTFAEAQGGHLTPLADRAGRALRARGRSRGVPARARPRRHHRGHEAAARLGRQARRPAGSPAIRDRTTSSSSAAARPARPPATGWPRPATTSCVVERKTFPARRPAATGSRLGPCTSSRRWASATSSTRFHRYDGLRAMRPRHHARAEVAGASRVPVVRLRRAPARPRPDGGRARRRRRRRRCARAPRRSRRCIDGGLVRGAIGQRQDDRHDRGDPGPLRRRSPTAPTHASGAPSARPATARYPQGMAIRGYFESPLHAEPWIESALDVRDRNGNSLPGYGWIFPVGDGTINVGIGLLSTFRDFKIGQHDPPHGRVRGHRAGVLGHLARRRRPARRPAGGCRWAGRSAPKVGPTWLVVGDAAGSINPFNGEGIDYAYETGRMAAALLDEALTTGDGLVLQQLPASCSRTSTALYFKVARLFAKVIGNPALMQRAHPRRHAVAHAHGVGAAHHGQPAARRRARPGRGRLQERPPTIVRVVPEPGAA